MDWNRLIAAVERVALWLVTILIALTMIGAGLSVHYRNSTGASSLDSPVHGRHQRFNRRTTAANRPDQYDRNGRVSRGQKRVLRHLKKCNCLLSRNRRESFQEVIERITAFDVVQQMLNRNARTGEHRCSPQNLWIRMIDFAAIHDRSAPKVFR